LVITLGDGQFRREPAPLRGLYVIRSTPSSARPTVTIRRLPERRAFVELGKNTFNTRVTDPDRLKRHFDHAARLASSLPVSTLSYPRSLGSLPSVREAILRDVARRSPRHAL
jgi:hypothetical protein